MKKTVLFVLIISISACALYSCAPYSDKALCSLGAYKSREFYSEGAFQDFTDYAKYHYYSVDFSDNEYFTKIEHSGTDNLNAYLDNFEKWIKAIRENDESCEIVMNYDFDRSLIDNEDYLYIYFKNYEFDGVDYEDMKFFNYSIYFFDVQTNTLYYFHNNI